MSWPLARAAVSTSLSETLLLASNSAFCIMRSTSRLAASTYSSRARTSSCARLSSTGICARISSSRSSASSRLSTHLSFDSGAFFASSIISYSISSSFCTFSSAIVIPYPFLLSEPRPQPANTSRAADDTSPSRAPWSMKCAGAQAQRTKAPCRARRRTHPYK